MLTIEPFTANKGFMIQILQESSGSLICIKVSGKLTIVEYKHFITTVEYTIRNFGAIKFYVDTRDLDSLQWAVVWDDLRFGIRNWNKFSKIVVVGSKRWMQFPVWVVNKIMPGEIRYSRGNETIDALTWIKS